jgi:hypothetical protein
MKKATFVENAGNRKTGKVAATYVSQDTCPDSCALKKSGCYAEKGFVAITTQRLNNAGEMPAEQISLQEASLIRKAAIKVAKQKEKQEKTGKRYETHMVGKPLRLHVVGDFPSQKALDAVDSACGLYTENGGGKAWSYTHNWATLQPAENISLLASVDSLSDGLKALAKGFAPAGVVESFESEKTHKIQGVKWIPCPEQTGKAKNCKECGLCFNAERLAKGGLGILFKLH